MAHRKGPTPTQRKTRVNKVTGVSRSVRRWKNPVHTRFRNPDRFKKRI